MNHNIPPAALKTINELTDVINDQARRHAALRTRVAELEEALRIIADRKNWRTLNGEIVWNDFDGNDYHTEHAMSIAAEALK